MINEIDLNDLAIKTDSLPDSWKLLLIDSTTGLPAQNIHVSRFIELLTQKLPEATNFTKGLMSELDFIASMRNKGSFSDKTLNSITETGVYISHGGHPGPWGIMAVFKGYLYIFQLIANPHFFTIRCSTSNGAEWSSTTIGLNSDTISLAENSLTEAISLNNSTLPPPQIVCQTIQNQQVPSNNLRNPPYRTPSVGKIQFQLILNLPNNSGRSIRSARLYWNCKKKTRDLNKSSISQITRYNKCNHPRAGPWINN